jgi:ATP-binding cassette subfamily B protein
VKLGIVFRFWRRHRLLAAGIVVLTVVATAISMAFPWVLRLIVDGIKAGITPERLLRYVVILALFGLLRAFGDVLMPFIRGRVNELYQWETRSAVFRRVLDAGHSFANAYPTGDVMERLDHDMQELSWFACSGLFRFLAAALTAIFALVVMARMNWFLTLIAVLPAGLAAYGWTRLGPRIYVWFMKWREKISEVNNQLESAFSGIRLVKAYVMESKLSARFRRTLDERVTVVAGEARVEAWVQVFYMAVAEVATLIVLWAGGWQVIARHLTLGEFVAFNAYILMLLGPMFDIGNLFVSGRRAQGTGERIEALKNHALDVVPATAGAAPGPGELRLENVTFAYTTRPVLSGVTMAFAPGRKVGIAGTVGSGKSTIIRLLSRLADPQQGRVTLGGRDIRELDLAAYRRLFGYAPQEPMLFSDTIRNNIAFGREGADDEQLARVVTGAELAADVAAFPKGLDEVLGERGTRLSGGQRERVAIARAILGRPPVLLFDDATSALDAETEKELVERLMTRMPETAAVVVSHRLSVLSACDRIYVLDAGEVKEEGTHAELLERHGLYWKLYQRQLIEQELEQL